jgi:Ca2+-transporting ATPase
MQYNLRFQEQFDKVATLEFTRDRKSMGVLYKPKNGDANSLYVKGAPEGIVGRCNMLMLADGSTVPFSQGAKDEVLKRVNTMAEHSLRTLAMAVKRDGSLVDYNGSSHPEHKKFEEPENFKDFEQEMIFVGVAGIRDPPRPEVKDSIDLCK